jgi:hypothetical protein
MAAAWGAANQAASLGGSGAQARTLRLRNARVAVALRLLLSTEPYSRLAATSMIA